MLGTKIMVPLKWLSDDLNMPFAYFFLRVYGLLPLYSFEPIDLAGWLECLIYSSMTPCACALLLLAQLLVASYCPPSPDAA